MYKYKEQRYNLFLGYSVTDEEFDDLERLRKKEEELKAELARIREITKETINFVRSQQEQRKGEVQ